MRQIGISIPTFMRPKMTINSFIDVYGDERIKEVTIVDDNSPIENYNELKQNCELLLKVKLFRNETNQDCYKNKHTSLMMSSCDWNILLDSDNEIGQDYLWEIFSIPSWQDNTAYLPSFASPFFNYTKYEGLVVTKENVRHYLDDATFTTCLNTANYFVNRNFYMQCWDGSGTDPITADSIYMNYLYLKNGGKLHIVPRLTYQHRVDNHGEEQKGHYVTNQHRTGNFHEEVLKKLKDLR
jgi:glycosyltransferase involved in cell wall biosynthesis